MHLRNTRGSLFHMIFLIEERDFHIRYIFVPTLICTVFLLRIMVDKIFSKVGRFTNTIHNYTKKKKHLTYIKVEGDILAFFNIKIYGQKYIVRFAHSYFENAEKIKATVKCNFIRNKKKKDNLCFVDII